ncbi:hypothetical protein J7F01_08925 [Streptomyces sp. ISL-22]|uniref:hypothetical protein n=1 Tax=unclassified Streptomyces TaxID=2593676 RepID=UPI001BE82B83|nr:MULTISPECIES: hypothetical protein [unclassified Streptomyces]MBT2418000.1 hypothetical protein [Streptomyces sp. ISL-24]MBT2432325.1 hypothetical protein [Streptomyces sp. ISL-22]
MTLPVSSAVATSGADDWSPLRSLVGEAFVCADGRLVPVDECGDYLLRSTVAVAASEDELPVSVRELDLDALQRSW